MKRRSSARSNGGKKKKIMAATPSLSDPDWRRIALYCILSFDPLKTMDSRPKPKAHKAYKQSKQILTFALVCKQWQEISTDLFYILVARYRSGREVVMSPTTLYPAHFTSLPDPLIGGSGSVIGIMLFRLTSLTSLDLRDDPHGEEHDTTQTLRFLTNLNSLYLTITSHGREGEKPMIDHLIKLTKLETMDVFFSYPPHPNLITSLKSLKLGEIYGRKIREKRVAPFTALTSLNLQCTTITSKFINSLSNLTKLNLGCSEVRLDSLTRGSNLLSLGVRDKGLCSANALMFPNITSLEVENNWKWCNLKEFHNLRRLKLHEIPRRSGKATNIEELILKDLSDTGDLNLIFDRMKMLTSLVFKECEVDASGLLTGVMERMTGLKTLKIKTMTITPDFCEELNEVVPLKIKNGYCERDDGELIWIESNNQGGFDIIEAGPVEVETDSSEVESSSDSDDAD